MLGNSSNPKKTQIDDTKYDKKKLKDYGDSCFYSGFIYGGIFVLSVLFVVFLADCKSNVPSSALKGGINI
jgi:hypothetical protein